MAYNGHMYKYHRTCKKPPKGTPCGYCFSNFATGYDHIIPVSYDEDNSKENLYPSCIRCNRLLSNLMFVSLEAKRDYIKQKLIELNQWDVKLDKNIKIIIPFEIQNKQNLQITSKIIKPDLEIICKSCGKTFTTKRLKAVYCNPSCQKMQNKKIRAHQQGEKLLQKALVEYRKSVGLERL